MALIDSVKLALQITSNTLNDDINNLISSAIIDLDIAGVDNDISTSTTDANVIRAITAYVGYHFNLTHGSIDRAKAFKTAYDEMKAQMGMSDNYTVFEEDES